MRRNGLRPSVPSRRESPVLTFFLVSALVGGGVLVLQLLLGLVGLDHGTDAEVDVEMEGGHSLGHDALDLLSVRSVAAGLAFFGLTGLALQRSAGVLLAAVAGVVAGMAALAATGFALRLMKRAESDGAAHVEDALGLPATVYLSVRGPAGPGKVHVVMGGRTIEFQAVSPAPLPSGTAAVVTGVVGPDTVEVEPIPQLGGPNDA